MLWRGRNGGSGVLLVGTRTPDSVELWEWNLGADDEHSSDAHAKGTRELLQVHSGSVSVRSGNDVQDLAAGDAIVFAGDVAHAYANTGPNPASFRLAVFKPNIAKH